MRKLKLEPEELVVESFATDGARGRVGTVHGQVTLVGPGCASVEVCNTRASIECACSGACATANASCNGTCDAACGGGGSGFYTDCYPCSQAGHIC